jgi:hypothetical protein
MWMDGFDDVIIGAYGGDPKYNSDPDLKVI